MIQNSKILKFDILCVKEYSTIYKLMWDAPFFFKQKKNLFEV